MFVSEGVSPSGESTLEGATHEDGRDRGELVPGELEPVEGCMGNCRDRRFPWPTTSTWEVVFERECGIDTERNEGERVVVREVGVEVEEAVEEAGSWISPMQLVSRVCVWARSTLSAAPTQEELDLSFFSATQAKVVRRIR
jgi:hypothetical protein